jgi:hypothetical protein
MVFAWRRAFDSGRETNPESDEPIHVPARSWSGYDRREIHVELARDFRASRCRAFLLRRVA